MVWLEQHHCCPESAFTALQVLSTNGILPLSITSPPAGQGLLSAGTAAPAEQELVDPEQELSPAAPRSCGAHGPTQPQLPLGAHRASVCPVAAEL